MSKRVADVLIETLQAAGVKRCYGIVGDTLNQIARAISADSDEGARVYRTYSAHRSNLMPPTNPI